MSKNHLLISMNQPMGKHIATNGVLCEINPGNYCNPGFIARKKSLVNICFALG
jgi:hypothetical protein